MPEQLHYMNTQHNCFFDMSYKQYREVLYPGASRKLVIFNKRNNSDSLDFGNLHPVEEISLSMPAMKRLNQHM